MCVFNFRDYGLTNSMGAPYWLAPTALFDAPYWLAPTALFDAPYWLAPTALFDAPYWLVSNLSVQPIAMSPIATTV
jgi:hypothetical protein